MSFLDKYRTPESEKAFWESMKICKGQRKDGKDGKCISPLTHNLSCVGCLIGDAGLFEPEELTT
ncbi:MAG: hypothetical protein PHE79_11500 [Eubacteriales bacterium]|nr:hypothetical protein [Eubacteriales bacterium]